jgi:coenzyme F420-reducing hydrogenase alpha subunit
MPEKPAAEPMPRAVTSYGCTEAPRGICWHKYQIDDEGAILDARIVPPTSQNQKIIEKDLFHFVKEHIDLPQDRLTWMCEQVVRNYDPCISCSCHFLKLKIERT